MRYFCIVSLLPSADWDQGEIAAPEEVSILLFQTGSAEERFLVTYINAYLKKKEKKSLSVQLYIKFSIFTLL